MNSSKRGVALLLVMVSLVFLSVIAIEISFSSRVELAIGRNARDRLQAGYLAAAGARLSMLRLHLYKEVKNLAESKQLPINLPPQLVDQIWSFAMPVFPLPTVKADWPGTMLSFIQSEGSKLPINLLDGNIHRGSSAEMATSVRAEIETIIKSMFEDEEFYKTYRDLEAKDLLDPLVDWIDSDTNKVDSRGDEDADYDRLESPYFPRNGRIPALSELGMISGWTYDLTRRLKSNFSVINTSDKVNPNFIPIERIRAYGPELSNEDLKVIQKRRLDVPFANLKELQDFINSDPNIKNGRGFNFPSALKDSPRETVFFVEATGEVGSARRTLRLGIRMREEAIKEGKSDDPPPRNPKPAKLEFPEVVTVEELL